MKDLKTIVSNLKRHIKAMGNENVIELIAVDDTIVTFEATDIANIIEGVAAEPDGEFLFQDGTKIVVKGGKVESIEIPQEEKTEEEKTEEEAIENVVEEMPEAQTEEAPEQDEKDVKIAELEAEIAKLSEALKTKEEEINEVEKDLEEIKNFYSEMKTTSNDRTVEEKQEKQEKRFKYTKK